MTGDAKPPLQSRLHLRKRRLVSLKRVTDVQAP
jgi:hypothetical protein